MRYHRSHTPGTCSWTAICFMLVALSAFAAQSAWSQISPTLSSSQTFRPHTPRQVQNGAATLIGRYNPNQMLRLTIGLQPPHVAEERLFLDSVQTKGSHDFHQFLSAQEWTDRFDPSAQDEQAVVNWLVSQGLTVTHRYPNRLLVDVAGTAATIERAFGVTMNSYQVETRALYY